MYNIGINLFSLNLSGQAGGTLNYMLGLLKAIHKIDEKNKYIIICHPSKKKYWEGFLPRFQVVDLPHKDPDIRLQYTYFENSLGNMTGKPLTNLFYHTQRWIGIITIGGITFKKIIAFTKKKNQKHICQGKTH